MKRRRSTIEIAACILKRTMAEPMTISRITFSENLSFRVVKKLVTKLVASRLMVIVKQGRTELYSTTAMGQEFLSSYRKVIESFEGTAEPLLA